VADGTIPKDNMRRDRRSPAAIIPDTAGRPRVVATRKIADVPPDNGAPVHTKLTLEVSVAPGTHRSLSD
jgi:hypothetical protein